MFCCEGEINRVAYAFILHIDTELDDGNNNYINKAHITIKKGLTVTCSVQQ